MISGGSLNHAKGVELPNTRLCLSSLDHSPRIVLPQDFENGSLYGLEKFWAFHHYGGVPKGVVLEVNPKVRAPLVVGVSP